MTTSYRKFLERSQPCLQRILRKPAWDFNGFVRDPRQPKGRAVEVPHPHAGPLVRVLDEPYELTCGRELDGVWL